MVVVIVIDRKSNFVWSYELMMVYSKNIASLLSYQQNLLDDSSELSFESQSDKAEFKTKLAEFSKLYLQKKGIISKEEFELKKKDLLNL